ERFGLEFRATALSAMQAGELGKALSGFSEVDAIEIAEIGEAPDGASAGANAGVGAVSGAGVRAAGAKAEAGEGAGGAEAAEAAGAPDAAGAASREGAAPAPESAGALPPGEPLAAGPASAAAATAGAPARKRLPMSKTVKVDIARLDALLNLVSELIIEKSRLQGVAELAGAPRLAGELEYLDRLASSLHEMTMRARMVSIGSVFSRFPKMVRDISQALGKEVELEIAGEDTELDRTVIDELGEPLLHILRNCIDHGIEDAETRARLGKPARGRVRMSASQSGADVLVEVRDDGGGIDIEKVRAKAAASGIVSGERAAAMTDGEAARLVFEPSLSTKDQVSELSGRGVGLDVVKTKIESFGGSVEIETAKSAGTKISIRLPVSLVVVSALLVEAGSEKYAVSLSAVAEVVKVGADEIGRTQGRMVMLLRDALIPVISLAEALGCDPAAAAAEHAGARPAAPQDILTIVVARIGEKYFGMIADAVLGQHELVQKPLGPFFQNAKLVSGATILGDGSVALMLNAGALLI
ncbi:MAG: chemotaxis protein CheA, partial [Clostridiales bacterium]|nr:chemotaxis protein CheA [Clostridiales bacterium]